MVRVVEGVWRHTRIGRDLGPCCPTKQELKQSKTRQNKELFGLAGFTLITLPYLIVFNTGTRKGKPA